MKNKDVLTGRFVAGKVCGVGIYDLTTATKDEGSAYKIWRHIHMRCYSSKYQDRQNTYRGCYVSDSWKVYSNFKIWFEENYVDGFEIDKDLLGNGKEYSEDSCCFLPKKINLSLPKVNTRSETVTGVTARARGKFTTQILWVDGKIKHLGTFDSEKEAFSEYCKAKESVIKYYAEEFKESLSQEVYQELITLDVRDYSHKFLPEGVL